MYLSETHMRLSSHQHYYFHGKQRIKDGERKTVGNRYLCKKEKVGVITRTTQRTMMIRTQTKRKDRRQRK